MEVPTYVWIAGIIILSLNEFRNWIQLVVEFKNEVIDEEEPVKLPKELPKAVKHIYS